MTALFNVGREIIKKLPRETLFQEYTHTHYFKRNRNYKKNLKRTLTRFNNIYKKRFYIYGKCHQKQKSAHGF